GPASRRLEPVWRPDGGTVSGSLTVSAAMCGGRVWPNIRGSRENGRVFGLPRGGLRALRANQSPHGVLQPTGPGVRTAGHRGSESLAAIDLFQWTGVSGFRKWDRRNVSGDSGLHRSPLGTGQTLRADFGGSARRRHPAAELFEELRPVSGG